MVEEHLFYVPAVDSKSEIVYHFHAVSGMLDLEYVLMLHENRATPQESESPRKGPRSGTFGEGWITFTKT